MEVRRRAVAISAAVTVVVGAAGAPALAHEPTAPPPDRVAGGVPPKPLEVRAKARAGKARAVTSRRKSTKRRVIARAARTTSRTKPILFVHGLDAFGDAGADCA